MPGPTSGEIRGSRQVDQIHDAAGRLIRRTPAGNTTHVEYRYDSLGRQIEQINPLGHKATSSFNAAGLLIASTDPLGNATQRRYDPAGRLITLITPTGQTQSYRYDVAGHQNEVIDGGGHRTLTEFDAAGRIISQTDPEDHVTTFVYDADGNQTTTIDPSGSVTSYQFDHLGRQTAVIDANGRRTEEHYNLAGDRIASVDGKGQTTVYEFDALGRQVSQIDRLGLVTTFHYTATGKLRKLTDAEGQATRYQYDGYDRQERVIWPDHVDGSMPGDAGFGITETQYDDLDRVGRSTDQLGDTVTSHYDEAGRLITREYRRAIESPTGLIADTDTFTYDAAGKMLSAHSGRYDNEVTFTYDDAGRKRSETLTIQGISYTTTTRYDAAGNVSALVYPDGREVTRNYSPRGQLAQILVGTEVLDSRTYDPSGRRLTSQYGNGVTESRTYQADGLLRRIQYTGAAIGDFEYTWDANQNKTSETITGVMSGYGFTASYDAEDRLTGYSRADSALDQSWLLSPVGDWNEFSENDTLQTRTHGPTHELLTVDSQAVTHDPKGNLTHRPASLSPLATSFSFDFDNRLSSADTNNNGTDDVFYQWDALGRRVGRSADGVSTVYVQNGQQTVADYASGSSPLSPDYTYVWGDYIDELVTRTDANGNVLYYHRNQQYSITAITNGSGSIVERYAYDAFGSPTITDASGTARTTSAENNRYTYTGREYDEALGLHHFRARMYGYGRFCSRDPIGYHDGTSLYQAYFVGKGLDPSGMGFLVTRVVKSQRWIFNTLGVFAATIPIKLKWVGEDIIDEFPLIENGIELQCAAVRKAKSFDLHLEVTTASLTEDIGFLTTEDGRNAFSEHEDRRVDAYRKAYDFYLEPASNGIANACGVICRCRAGEAKSELEDFLNKIREKARDAASVYLNEQLNAIGNERNFYVDADGNIVTGHDLLLGVLIDGISQVHAVAPPPTIKDPVPCPPFGP